MAYFGGNAVGQTLKINGTTFTVVGVMAQKGSELEEGSTDDCVFLPYSTAARLSFTGTIGSYTITVQDTDNISEAKTFLENKLYDIFSDDDAYTVISMAEMVEEMNSMVNIIIYILAGIAAISLVVGGIGIMNIMLVTVTERTREIGIRRSLGAQRSSIVAQFLIESGMLCGMGGLVGIAFGTIGSLVLGKILFQMTIFPATWVTLAAFGLSVALGVLFGSYPAAKASKLQPVEALRAD